MHVALEINMYIEEKGLYILYIQEIYTLQAHMSNRDTDIHYRMEMSNP